MIQFLKGFPTHILTFTCKGHVTSSDYDNVLIPAVQKALKDHRKIRLYYEIGTVFEGVDPGAVWKDFKVGMAHLMRWERLAVVTDVSWIRHTIQIFAFVMPGELRIFPTSEAQTARNWIIAS